jgi:hypothetical protein
MDSSLRKNDGKPRHSRADGNPEGGMEGWNNLEAKRCWIPACAGMTVVLR